MAHDEGPHMIPGGDRPQWVKFEMYGLLPPGQGVVDVQPEELARFGRSLGFTHIGAVTAVLAEPPEPKLAVQA